MPYARDERLARPWAIPGTPGLMHRIGGLEKQDITGNVNYEAANHQHMVNMRAAKVAGIASDIPPLAVEGAASGDAPGPELGRHVRLVCHRGSRAERSRPQGRPCASALSQPVPGEPRRCALRGSTDVLIPELNLGQLRLLIRGQFLVDAVGLNKVQGKPFVVAEIVKKIESLLSTNGHSHPHDQTHRSRRADDSASPSACEG